VGLREYATIGALAAALGTMAFIPLEADEANWTGPILFDDAVRDGMTFNSSSSRKTARDISNILSFGSIAYPMLIDNLLVTLVARQSPDVAWQMFVINTQAYALSMSLNSLTKRVALRERPWGEKCERQGTEYDCESANRFESFYSGHSSFTATGAGLTCAHHTQLTLYKNPIADTSACVMAIGFTTATGVLRIASDNHWATDVIVGHFMGYVSGYLLPTLLYYKEFRSTPETHHEPEPANKVRVIVLPIISDQTLRLTASGLF
jgi:membrane-associated phospholipid phosphatase